MRPEKFTLRRARNIDSLFTWLQLPSLLKLALFIVCALIAATTVWLLPEDSTLMPAGQRALFILVFATGLWITEAIPAYAVGILVIALQIALLGQPGGVYAETAQDWEQFISVIGHPLVWLFFGGFVLAAGMAKTGLDRQLAKRILSRVGNRPEDVLLGVMAITFVLSMFISNTATTAMMLAMLAPLLRNMEPSSSTATSLVLGLAVAANLGGMASLIGTPANAIAVGALAQVDGLSGVSFLDWLMIGLPPGLALLALAVWWLRRNIGADAAPLDSATLDNDGVGKPAPGWQVLTMGFTLLATIGLWLSSGLHGIPPTAVSFLPIVLLTATGVLGATDIRGLNYDVLFLLAGGLALGQLVSSTGLSSWLVSGLPLDQLGQFAMVLAMALFTVFLSNLMSNTAAANILIPLGVALATGFEAQMAIPIALSASVAMSLPISTPPNAMVYASGRCSSGDFLKLGTLVGLIGPLIVTIWSLLILRLVS